MGRGIKFSGKGGSNTNTGSNNGGIMGSGIFGMVGSSVHCNANDTSLYCSLSKLVSGLMMLLFLFAIFYLIYFVFNNSSISKKMRGGKWRMK